MLSLKIKENLDDLLGLFQRNSGFIECLSLIDKSYFLFDENIRNLGSQDGAVGVYRQFSSTVANFKNSISSLKPRIVFEDIDALKSDLINAKGYGLKDSALIDNILTCLDRFLGSYEIYIENYSVSDVTKLALNARDLLFALDKLQSCLVFYINNFFDKPELYVEESELSLILGSKMNFEDFVNKLKSINVIYFEICGVMSVSTLDFPLQIIKIESGGLWVKVFGNSKVIEIMSDFFKGGASFVYRNYTVEGKIQSIPRKIEILEDVLKFSEKLESHGIDSSQIKDHINKSSILIIKELNNLLSGEPEIIVNQEKISISDSLIQKRIEMDSIPKIEYDDE